MFIKSFGHPVYGPEGAQGGADGGNDTGAGGEGGAPPPAPSGDGSGLPWGDINNEWKVGDKPWYEHLPDGPTKELFVDKKYANPFVAADAYHNINKMVSGKGVVAIPGENATQEELAEFHAKLGRPASKDDYKFEFPEGAQTDETMIGFGKEVAYDLGLNPKQAQTLANKWQDFVTAENTKAVENMRAQNDRELAELQTKYGGEFNAHIEAGKRVYQSLGLDAAFVDRIEAQIGAAPLVELLARIGRASDEGAIKAGGAGGDPGSPESMTPEAAAAEIQRLSSDADFQSRYTDRNNAGHKDAVDKMARLFARAGNKAG